MQAWVDLLNEANSYYNWGLFFVSECDGTLSADPGPEEVEGSAVHRWWPGPGSKPMALVVRPQMQQYVKSVRRRGRAISIHMNSRGYDWLYVFMHGGHGDALEESLADATVLFRHRKRHSKVMLMGDFNVDYLPTLEEDPWKMQPGRQSRHRLERDTFSSWMSSLRVTQLLPCSVTGAPGGAWNAFAQTPFSRVPTGEQMAVPSLLDYA